MATSKELQAKIFQRFDSLIAEGEKLYVDTSKYEKIIAKHGYEAGDATSTSERCYTFSTKAESLVTMVLSHSQRSEYIVQEIRRLTGYPGFISSVLGRLRGLRDDLETGMLDDLRLQVEVNVIANYMEQAERLLDENASGDNSHVPAAVLAGAVLEDALRRLCERQSSPISIVKENGDPKTLNVFIDDLKKAEVFNELKAKQLRAWVDVRNAAAHGKFTDFTRQDVEVMLKGIASFLADYL
jgi:hypothetical protein